MELFNKNKHLDGLLSGKLKAVLENGKPVEILCFKKVDGWPIVGLVDGKDLYEWDWNGVCKNFGSGLYVKRVKSVYEKLRKFLDNASEEELKKMFEEVESKVDGLGYSESDDKSEQTKNDVYLVMIQSTNETTNYVTTFVNCFSNYEKAKAFVDELVDGQMILENNCIVCKKYDKDVNTYEAPPVVNGCQEKILYLITTGVTDKMLGTTTYMDRFIIKKEINKKF